MLDVYNKYGCCIIPKGTLLFRIHSSKVIKDIMFFGLKKKELLGYLNIYKTNKIQIWETKKEVKLLFLVKEIDSSCRSTSAIVDLYKKYFKVQNDDVDWYSIKQNKKFFDKLKQNKIIGFLNSMEEGTALEICIFSSRNDAILKKINTISTDKKEYDYVNSLNVIKIFPGNLFYQLSSEKISVSYKEHKEYINECINEIINYGVTKKQAINYSENLRIKLKI